MSDDDLIDEFDVFPDAPNSKPVILKKAPTHAILPNPVKTSDAALQKTIQELYRKIYLKFIRSDCPKDKETRDWNEQLIRLTKNSNESTGGRKTKSRHHKNHRKTRKGKKGKK
jgi:hypothetical protein